MAEKLMAGTFVFEPAASSPVGSVLYNEHLKLTDKSHIADFAGYLMPLWYSSIAEEHAAVRKRAGVFDCTHMGALEVVGSNAEAFLDAATTNNIRLLQPGCAQYGYLLDAAGNVLDDIIIYRREKEKFMVVVNASNEPKAKTYFAALNAGKVTVDLTKPDRKIKTAPIRDMRDIQSGSDCRVDIAVQGPASVEVLTKLTDATTISLIKTLKSFTFIEGKVSGINCIIATTGYTGAKVCFELFVHPKDAAKLWHKVIEAGALPCGLGSRDSLRVEAGLPLYGHELDGPYNISPFEAGYGWAVKLDKEFFIGKAAMEKNSKQYKMKVARIELSGEKGVRPVRQNDAVISGGACVGWVLSSAAAGTRQITLVYIDKGKANEGNSVDIYYLARSESQVSKGRKQTVKYGEKIGGDIKGKILSRFEKF